MNLKKKAGPLPVWAWLAIAGATIGIFLLYRSRAASSSGTPSSDTVDPTNPLGLTYGQEASDQAAGIDPLTGATYASEQPAATAPDTSGDSGGSGGVDSGTDPSTGDPYGAEILTALQNGAGLTDNPTAGQTFAGELGDFADSVSEITALENALRPAAQTVKAKLPALVGAGALRAPAGMKAPTAPKGYTVRGLGNGNWEFVPKTTPSTNQTSAGSGNAGASGSGSGNATTVKHVLDTKTGTKKTVLPKPKLVRGKKH